MHEPVSGRDAMIRAGAMLIAFAAGLCVIVAFMAYGVLCVYTESADGQCVEGRGPNWALVAQIIVAFIGFGLAVAMLNRVWRGAWRTAARLFALTLLACGGWGVLLASAA